MQRGNNNNHRHHHHRVAVHQACASCKHQRKRCTEDCVLAPYFPADRSDEFQAVHKVYGVSNVVRLVKDVIEERRKEAANSLVWEAKCRKTDPVLGSYGKYRKIEEEFELYKLQYPPNQNQLLGQQQQQGGVVYKQHPRMAAWNGSNNGINNRPVMNNNGNINGGGGGGVANNNNMVNYGHDHNSNLIVDSFPHNYRWLDNSNQERDAGSLVLPLIPPPLQPPHQHSVNGFPQQQYYLPLPGQFGTMNGLMDDRPLENFMELGEEEEGDGCRH